MTSPIRAAWTLSMESDDESDSDDERVDVYPLNSPLLLLTMD